MRFLPVLLLLSTFFASEKEWQSKVAREIIALKRGYPHYCKELRLSFHAKDLKIKPSKYHRCLFWRRER